MEIYTEKHGAKTVLFLFPDNYNEERKFANFARLNQPLTTQLKKDNSYASVHIEITKEL